MVNSTDFGKRIQKVMDFHSLSASGFADEMGVGRSSISHILSGRNRPSLEFVMKIVEAYPKVDLQWLLYGKGNFPKSDHAVKEVPESKKEAPTEVLSTSKTQEELTMNQDLFSKPNTEGEIENNTNSSIAVDHVIKQRNSDQKINRVLIFYNDGTFEDFVPK